MGREAEARRVLSGNASTSDDVSSPAELLEERSSVAVLVVATSTACTLQYMMDCLLHCKNKQEVFSSETVLVVSFSTPPSLVTNVIFSRERATPHASPACGWMILVAFRLMMSPIVLSHTVPSRHLLTLVARYSNRYPIRIRCLLASRIARGGWCCPLIAAHSSSTVQASVRFSLTTSSVLAVSWSRSFYPPALRYNNPAQVLLSLIAPFTIMNLLTRIFCGTRREKAQRMNQQLLHAALYGNLELVEQALQNGANLDATNHWGKTPLHLVCWYGHLDVVQYLLTSHAANLEATDNNGWTPLIEACYEGHLTVVKYLATHGANVEAVDNEGLTPLHFACKNGRLALVQELVARGANLGSTNNHGCTALHLACIYGRLAVVQELVTRGANLGSTDNRGCTALHLACIYGRLAVVQELVARGANLGSTDNDGWTPLLFACKNGHLALVQELVTHGADLFVTAAANGTTAFDLARQSHRSNVVDYLLHAYAAKVSAREGLQAIHSILQASTFSYVKPHPPTGPFTPGATAAWQADVEPLSNSAPVASTRFISQSRQPRAITATHCLSSRCSAGCDSLCGGARSKCSALSQQ